MKDVYLFVLGLALLSAGFLQVVSIATPRHVLVAAVLSSEPEGWEVSLGDRVRESLGPYYGKAELLMALREQAASVEDQRSRMFWACIVMIAFAAVGFLRERKLERMRRAMGTSASMY